MKVTRDVVIDLWPVYESGEASADTRAMVEEFLKEDPEFARLIREERTQTMLNPVAVALPPDHEKTTLTKTKMLLSYRTDCLIFSLVCMSAASMLRLYRGVVLTAAVLAWLGWFGLWINERRLRVKGL